MTIQQWHDGDDGYEHMLWVFFQYLDDYYEVA